MLSVLVLDVLLDKRSPVSFDLKECFEVTEDETEPDRLADLEPDGLAGLEPRELGREKTSSSSSSVFSLIFSPEALLSSSEGVLKLSNDPCESPQKPQVLAQFLLAVIGWSRHDSGVQSCSRSKHGSAVALPVNRFTVNFFEFEAFQHTKGSSFCQRWSGKKCSETLHVSLECKFGCILS